MAKKKKKTNKQTHNNTQFTEEHRKLKTELHKLHLKLGVISGSPKGSVDPACGTRRVARVITHPVNSLIQLVTFVIRELDCSYDIRNISDIICETDIP